MPFIRIAWVICLILAAATLPTGAQALPSSPESENRTPDQARPQDTPQPVSNETDENKDDSPAAILIIQTADMWNGSSPRTLSKVTVPVPSVKCIPGTLAGLPTPPDLQTSAGAEISIPSVRLLRRWFVSRYAHAPPYIPRFA